MSRNRREFLSQVGQGMLVAAVGNTMAANLGVRPAYAGDDPRPLQFGAREPLVALLQGTPPDRLLPILVSRLRSGLSLNELVAAGALANARTFGGHDYNGYHAFMALAPALRMAQATPESHRPLPVLKVLYRNTSFIESFGGRQSERLHEIEHHGTDDGPTGADLLREATRRRDVAAGERALAGLLRSPLPAAFSRLQEQCVQDDTDVHRVVLAWRAWEALDLTGKDAALTMLRQTIRFCSDAEQNRIRNNRPEPGIRAALPKLLDQYRLAGRSAGQRRADDAWIDRLSETVYAADRARAAEAVAAALAEGFAPDDIAEAISLAANRLVLRDPGRESGSGDKPAGSVHGASVGVHASDAANAWRNITRVVEPRTVLSTLIVAAYHTAGQAGHANRQPLPWSEHLDAMKSKDAGALLAEADAAIRDRDQPRVCAIVHRYGELGFPPQPVFQLLLRYATSEDGALHAEKYYQTVAEEFGATRPAFRWRHLVGLARVTASEYGFPAPGYDEASRLLGS